MSMASAGLFIGSTGSVSIMSVGTASMSGSSFGCEGCAASAGLCFASEVSSAGGALLGVLDLGRFRGVGGTDPKSALPPYLLYEGESTRTLMVH